MAEFNPAITARRARRLRMAMTDSEARLWMALRDRPGGLKWRKQHASPPFILDFYNAERRVAVEIDGDSHEGEGGADRDAALHLRGVKVLRVRATAVRDQLENVVDWITDRALSRPALGPRASSDQEV
jgi:very-short-patch-repair endonuclease